jgi:hypothetical protein
MCVDHLCALHCRTDGLRHPGNSRCTSVNSAYRELPLRTYFRKCFQCYFLLSASPALPILYYVERLREGKTYATRSVKAVQNGQVVFTLLCSFQKAETWQPSHQLSLPFKIPEPEECQTMAQRFRAAAAEPGMHERRKETLLSLAEVRLFIILAIFKPLPLSGTRTEQHRSPVDPSAKRQVSGWRRGMLRQLSDCCGRHESLHVVDAGSRSSALRSGDAEGISETCYCQRKADTRPSASWVTSPTSICRSHYCSAASILTSASLGVAPSIMGLKRHERSAEALGMIVRHSFA